MTTGWNSLFSSMNNEYFIHAYIFYGCNKKLFNFIFVPVSPVWSGGFIRFILTDGQVGLLNHDTHLLNGNFVLIFFYHKPLLVVILPISTIRSTYNMIRSDCSAADATTLVPGMFFSPGVLYSGLKGPKKSDMIKWWEEMSIVATSTLYRIALVQLIPLISSERFMKEDQENRNYLGVFTIVKFSNDACQG